MICLPGLFLDVIDRYSTLLELGSLLCLKCDFTCSRRWATTASQQPHLRPQTLEQRRPRSPRRRTTRRQRPRRPRPTMTSRGPRPRPRRTLAAMRRARPGRGRARGGLRPRTGASRTPGGRTSTSTRCNGYCHTTGN